MRRRRLEQRHDTLCPPTLVADAANAGISTGTGSKSGSGSRTGTGTQTGTGTETGTETGTSGLDLVDEAVPALLRVRLLWLVQSAVDGVNVVELALVD